MAHRIYLYNVDPKTNESYHAYLGEWNYEIPLVLIPLFSYGTKAKGKLILAEKEGGIIRLHQFYNFLKQKESFRDDPNFKSTIETLFSFLKDLPFSHFQLDATDVFNMREESHKEQVKDWVLEIGDNWHSIENDINTGETSGLNQLLNRRGYDSFEEVLKTDWINYGLGYFEYETYLKDQVIVYDVEGKFGLQYRNGEIITQPIFDEISDWSYSSFAVVRQGQKFGYINNKGELKVPCIYDDAFDATDIDEQSLAIVKLGSQYGLVSCETNTVLLDTIHDSIDLLTYHFYNISKDGIWQIYDAKIKEVLPFSADAPFEFDYETNLFYCKKSNSKYCPYYTKEGSFIGEFPKDTLTVIGDDFFVVKPNKFQKKQTIISREGEILDSEIDKILSFQNYSSFAYKKEGIWQLYDCTNKRYVLKEFTNKNITVGDFVYHFPDLFTVELDGEMGLFHAVENEFWIKPSIKYKRFDSLNYDCIKVTGGEGFYYFNSDSKYLSEVVDGIIALQITLDDNNFEFIVKKHNALYGVNSKLVEILIEEKFYAEIDDLVHYVSSLEHSVWNQFYDNWKREVGEDFELKFDAVTIKKLADSHFNEGNYLHALKLYQYAAKAGEQNAMIELGLLYTNPDFDFYNIREGLYWNQEAVKLNNPMAYNNLGYFYQNSIGYVFDKKKMIEAYERAAELGDGMAMGNLGDLYFYGEHVQQDYDRALHYYDLASSKFYDNNKNIVEIYYQKSEFEKLLKCLKKDDEKPYTYIYYGILYDEGFGVKRNAKKAVKYYEQALYSGDYSYALERLLFYYSEKGELANPEKWLYWKTYGKENNL